MNITISLTLIICLTLTAWGMAFEIGQRMNPVLAQYGYKADIRGR